MSKEIKIPQIETYGDATVPAFGIELFRSLLLPDLLGEDEDSVLYWAGRKIARQYPLHTTEEIIHFFHYAGWGDLTIDDQSKAQITFRLSSDIVSARIKRLPDTPFTIEAGFLAEQIQEQLGFPSEAYQEVKTGRNKYVLFKVKWDSK